MHVHYFALQDLSEPTGATAHVLGDVRGLQANGVRVSVTAVAPPDYPGIGDEFHALPPFRRASGVVAQAAALRRTVQAAVPRLRAALQTCDVAYTRHYMAADIFRKAGCPVPFVYEVNALPVQERRSHGRPMDYLVAARIHPYFTGTLRAAAHVVTVTPELRSAVANLYGIPAARCTVVQNGVDITLFRPDSAARAHLREQWGLAPDTPLLGYVGNCGVWQRFDLLLDALPAIRRAVPDVRVVIVGDGAYRHAWETQVRQRGHADICRFVGRVSLEESARAIAALDVALDLANRGRLSDLIGTAAVKVRAAIACGVPILAVWVPGIDFIEHAEVGRVAQLDGVSLATQAIALLQDPSLRNALGSAGRAYAEAHLSWEHVGRELRAVLESVCSDS